MLPLGMTYLWLCFLENMTEKGKTILSFPRNTAETMNHPWWQEDVLLMEPSLLLMDRNLRRRATGDLRLLYLTVMIWCQEWLAITMLIIRNLPKCLTLCQLECPHLTPHHPVCIEIKMVMLWSVPSLYWRGFAENSFHFFTKKLRNIIWWLLLQSSRLQWQ